MTSKPSDRLQAMVILSELSIDETEALMLNEKAIPELYKHIENMRAANDFMQGIVYQWRNEGK